MRGNLSVRVNNVAVTGATRDLRFRKTAPGGFHSASCRVILPPEKLQAGLGPSDSLLIHDTRNGQTVWEGFTENPGVTDGAAGQEFNVSAIGSMGLASDRSEAMLFIDKSFEHWRRGLSANIAPSATTELAVDPSTGEPALLMQFNPGQPIGAGSFAAMIYNLSDFPDLFVGGIKAEFVSGVTSANWGIRFITSDGSSDDFTFSTTVRTHDRVAVTDYPVDRQWAVLRITRAAGGATNVATDTIWTAFPELTVVGQLVDRYGATVTVPRFTHLTAAEVVEHLIGMGVMSADPDRSEVDTTGTAQIDQLVYLDGARPAEILEQLSLLEPDYYWGLGASREWMGQALYFYDHWQSLGREFWYRKWPTEPRYIISTDDEYSAPGGESDLCNQITVYWTDSSGEKRATRVTTEVFDLGFGEPGEPTFTGRVRDADPITLPDGLGSEANAQRIGEQVLVERANPPTAATAVIRRPIFDHLTGKTVMPWEIEPGYLVRIRETGEDLRLTEMEYVDSDCSANLTIGKPVRTTEEIVAALARKS